MRVKKVFFFFTISLVLLALQAHIGWTGRAEIEKQSALTVTESLRVMGKGADHIVVGEETLYVVPAITKITNSSGNAMKLKRLRIPCLADVTYARWWKGTDKLPVVLHLKVKRVYRGASAEQPLE